MIFFPSSRESFIELLPKSGVGCEIGVATCTFSQELIERTSPKKLHLIDPWIHQEREDYQADGNNVSNEEGERRYQNACNLFEDKIQKDEVEIHRAFSYDAVSDFPDQYFDWIYVDAVHSYDGVKKDLEDYLPKLKDHGILMGHDYANHVGAQSMGFGVVEAVDEFCLKHDMNFVIITYDAFPSFALTKSDNQKMTDYLSLMARMKHPEAIEISDYPKRNKIQIDVLNLKTERRLLFKFVPRD